MKYNTGINVKYVCMSLPKLEPDGTEVELVPGFRVIVFTGPCPEIFEGGGEVEFWIAGVFSK